MAFHASLTPNFIVANKGQKFTVEFDSSGSDRNAAKVQLIIFEEGKPDSFENQQQPTTLFKAFGKITDNVFETTATGTSKPSIEFPPGSFDEDGPIIEIQLNDFTRVRFGLPNADREHGVFELKLKVLRLEPKAPTFESKTPVFVRTFKHHQLKGVPRPVVTFILGDEGGFFGASEKFWEHHADVVLVKPGISAQEMLGVLDKESKKFGPWGQVNIVTHGRAQQLELKAKPTSPGTMHSDLIDSEMVGVTVPSGGIDGNTEIVFRACKFGQDQDLVEKIKSTFFPTAKFVKASKFLYRYESFGGSQSPAESGVEEIVFDIKGHTPLSNQSAELTKRKLEAFNELKTRSPGLSASADPDKEIPTFKRDAARDFSQQFKLRVRVDESKTVDSDGKALPNKDLVPIGQNSWSQTQINKTATWKTDHDRWEFTVLEKKDITGQTGFRGLWFEVGGTGVTAQPKFKVLGGGGEQFGTDGPWVVTGPAVESKHVLVEILSESRVKVTLKTNSATATVGGNTLQNAGSFVEAGVPVTVTFGNARLNVRRAKTFEITFEAKRMFMTFRRLMREFSATKDHPDRPLVAPDLDDSQQFATAK